MDRSYVFLLIALLVLACPISMWLMMRGHQRHRDRHEATGVTHRPDDRGHGIAPRPR